MIADKLYVAKEYSVYKDFLNTLGCKERRDILFATVYESMDISLEHINSILFIGLEEYDFSHLIDLKVAYEKKIPITLIEYNVIEVTRSQ